MVKVRYDEGLTNHIGPESGVAGREGVCEALTGVRAGQAIERRNIVLREAHAFFTAKGDTATIARGSPICSKSREQPYIGRFALKVILG
jgi:hypothetical protein